MDFVEEYKDAIAHGCYVGKNEDGTPNLDDVQGVVDEIENDIDQLSLLADSLDPGLPPKELAKNLKEAGFPEWQ